MAKQYNEQATVRLHGGAGIQVAQTVPVGISVWENGAWWMTVPVFDPGQAPDWDGVTIYGARLKVPTDSTEGRFLKGDVGGQLYIEDRSPIFDSDFFWDGLPAVKSITWSYKRTDGFTGSYITSAMCYRT